MDNSLVDRVVGWVEKWVGGVMKRPRLVFGLLLLASLASLWLAISQLGVNTNSADMINSQIDYRVRQQAVRAEFPQLEDVIVLVVQAQSPDQADIAAEALVTQLKQDQENFLDVFSATTDPFFVQNGLLYLSLEELETVSGRLGASAGLLGDIIANPTAGELFDNLGFAARVRDRAGFDSPLLVNSFDQLRLVLDAQMDGRSKPLSWQRLFGFTEDSDRAVRVVTVLPVLDFSSLQPAKKALAAVRQQVAQLQPAIGQGVSVGITGEAALRTEELKTVVDGIEVSVIISLVSVAILLGFGLRSRRLVGAALLSLLVSILLTAGVAAVLVGELNLVSIAFTVLLIGLGIDFSIHLVLNYQEKLNDGLENKAALRRATHQVGGALCLCAPTTAMAFFAFVPTDFTGMGQLGIISGVGVFIAFFVAITLLPAFLCVFPCQPMTVKPIPKTRTGDLVERFAGPIAIMSLLVGVAAVVISSNVKFDADPMNLRDPQSPSVQAFERLFDDPETVPYTLSVLTNSPLEAQRVADRLAGLAEVDHTRTIASFIPKDQFLKLELIDFLYGDLAPVFEVEPDLSKKRNTGAAIDRLIVDLDQFLASDAEETAKDAAERLIASLVSFKQALALRPELAVSLDQDLLRFFPFQMERLQRQLNAREVTVEDLPKTVRDRFVSDSGIYRTAIFPATDALDDDARRQFVEAVIAAEPRASGPAFNVLRAGDVVASSMLQATATAALVGSLILLLFLRNAFTVVLILLPLVLAGVLTAAASVLLDRPFNFANVIVLPLLIGLGMDSAIHLVMRVKESKQGRDIFSTSTPKAVFLSALTTILSFGSLSLNNHRGTASMGELLTIAIGLTLVATLVVLPGLLALARRNEPRHTPGHN